MSLLAFTAEASIYSRSDHYFSQMHDLVEEQGVVTAQGYPSFGGNPSIVSCSTCIPERVIRTPEGWLTWAGRQICCRPMPLGRLCWFNSCTVPVTE